MKQDFSKHEVESSNQTKGKSHQAYLLKTLQYTVWMLICELESQNLYQNKLANPLGTILKLKYSRFFHLPFECLSSSDRLAFDLTFQ